MISSSNEPKTDTPHPAHDTQVPTPDSRLPTPSATPARAWILRIAGTLIFVALLVWLDVTGVLSIQDVLATLARANPWLVGLSIAFYMPFLVVKSARWRLICIDMLMPLPWPDAWRIYAIGLAAGTFTPGQVGDVIKAWFLQRMGNPLGRSIGSSVLDRLFDVAGLAVLGLLGVVVYGQKFAGQTQVLLLIAAGCVFAVAFFAWAPTRLWLVGYVKRRLARLGLGGSGTPGESEWSLRPNTLVYVGLLTAASFAISVFRVWLLAAALGIVLGPLLVSGFVGLTTAAALVPVSVGGIGTRDAVAALALAQLGRPAAEAVALSSLILLLNLSQAIIGWVVWLRYRVDDRRQTTDDG
jgi:uncharacterized membrane protein YbhN (UPF0104 family)